MSCKLVTICNQYYFNIKLDFDRAADEEETAKILKYYNLKPQEKAKWNLYKDTDGKLINGDKNKLSYSL